MLDCCPTEFTDRAERLAVRIRLLVSATITWNLTEVVVALCAGTAAGSVALVGFGLDSIVEVVSAAALAWQFAGRDPERRNRRERATLRLIGVSFFCLTGWITLEATYALTGGEPARPSVPGVALAAASLLVMPVLSSAQRRTGRALGSLTAVADARQGMLCAWLSAALLVGLLANSTLGWSWADPAAALVIAAVAAGEGRDAWRGKGCCAVGSPRRHPQPTSDADPRCACSAPAPYLLATRTGEHSGAPRPSRVPSVGGLRPGSSRNGGRRQ